MGTSLDDVGTIQAGDGLSEAARLWRVMVIPLFSLTFGHTPSVRLLLNV
jgi:hypothetical protein